MTTPSTTPSLALRRFFAALIVALALAASGYLTRTGGTAQALTAPLASGIEELGDPAALPAPRRAPEGDPSVPSASSIFGRTIDPAADAAAPTF